MLSPRASASNANSGLGMSWNAFGQAELSQMNALVQVWLEASQSFVERLITYAGIGSACDLFRRYRFQKSVVKIQPFVVGLNAQPLIASMGANVIAINRNS